MGRSLVVCVVSLLLLGVTWPFVSNGGLPQVLWCLFALCGTVGGRLDPSTLEHTERAEVPDRALDTLA